ncbi:hypothetical protein P7K49_032202, partial [Saguinus oedipus]
PGLAPRYPRSPGILRSAAPFAQAWLRCQAVSPARGRRRRENAWRPGVTRQQPGTRGGTGRNK